MTDKTYDMAVYFDRPRTDVVFGMVYNFHNMPDADKKRVREAAKRVPVPGSANWQNRIQITYSAVEKPSGQLVRLFATIPPAGV